MDGDVVGAVQDAVAAAQAMTSIRSADGPANGHENGMRVRSPTPVERLNRIMFSLACEAFGRGKACQHAGVHGRWAGH